MLWVVVLLKGQLPLHLQLCSRRLEVLCHNWAGEFLLLEKVLVPAEGKQPPACFTMVETSDDVHCCVCSFASSDQNTISNVALGDVMYAPAKFSSRLPHSQQTSEPNSWRTHAGPARKSSSLPLVLLSFLRRHQVLGAAAVVVFLLIIMTPGGPWSAD